MKKVLVSMALAAVMAAPFAAQAASFDFNTATADEMVAACKQEGVTMPADVAAAIVAARPIKTEEALGKVPGMTPQLLMQLAPIDDGASLSFDPAGQPGMKGY